MSKNRYIPFMLRRTLLRTHAHTERSRAGHGGVEIQMRLLEAWIARRAMPLARPTDADQILAAFKAVVGSPLENKNKFAFLRKVARGAEAQLVSSRGGLDVDERWHLARDLQAEARVIADRATADLWASAMARALSKIESDEEKEELGAWKSAVPKAKHVRTTAVRWTGENYNAVQEIRRNQSQELDDKYYNYVKLINASLALYMRHQALRAPAVPSEIAKLNAARIEKRVIKDPRMWNRIEDPIGQMYKGLKRPAEMPAGLVLYRGFRIMRNQYEAIKQTGVLKDRGYMAFTRDKDVAKKFARIDSVRPYDVSVSLVAEVPLTNFKRGTPWIWFTDANPIFKGLDRKHVLPTLNPEEGEVLLPPGQLRFSNHQTWPEWKELLKIEAVASYEPEPGSAAVMSPQKPMLPRLPSSRRGSAIDRSASFSPNWSAQGLPSLGPHRESPSLLPSSSFHR